MNTKAACIAYAKDNLSECAAEILEWNRTAILKDGKLRELARMVSDWAGKDYDIQIAESIVKTAALDVVSQHNPAATGRRAQ